MSSTPGPTGPTGPAGPAGTGTWPDPSKAAWSGRSSDETGRQRKRQRQEVLLESCLRSVRHVRNDRGHEQPPEPGGRRVSAGDVQDRRRALKRIIDEALVEEAASRRKVHVARVRGDNVVGASSGSSSGRPSGGSVFGTGPREVGQPQHAGFHAQPPYREDSLQPEQPTRQDQGPQDDGELRLTDEEYLEMILRLEEELYQDFHGMGERGDQQCWDEMEDMDAAEIDAMVEAHLGGGPVNVNGCHLSRPVQEGVLCPVCRQAWLHAHPNNPYFFYCPASTSGTPAPRHGYDAGGPLPPASLETDALLQSSHCAMDLSSEGITLDRVGVRVRVCEHGHEATGCGGMLRFEMREGGGCRDGLAIPGAQRPPMPRMLVAICDGCWWCDVCL